MSNPWYSKSFSAIPGSLARAGALSGEFDRIQQAFDAFAANPYLSQTAADARYLPLTGGTVTGDLGIGGVLAVAGNATLSGSIVSTANAALSIRHNNAYIEAFNTAANTRTGYQQWNTGSAIINAAENGAYFTWSVGGTQRMQLDGLGLGLGVAASAGYLLDALGTIRSVGGEATTGYGIRVLNAARNGGGSLSAITGASAGLRLSSDAGPLYLWTSGAERVQVNTAGAVGIGTAGDLIRGSLHVRYDQGDGPIFMLENRSNNASSHRYGTIVFTPYRDVAAGAYGAAMWAEGASGGGYTADLVFGTSANGATAVLPTERLRIGWEGTVRILKAGSTFSEGLRLESAANAAGDLSPALSFSASNTNAAIYSSRYASFGGALVFATQGLGGGAPVARMTIDPNGVIADAGGRELGWRDTPTSTNTSGTFAIGDRGKVVGATGNWTVPAGVFDDGHTFSVFNSTGSSIQLTQGVGMTLYQAGTGATGNRTLGPYGLATIRYVGGPSAAVVTGAGLS